jgi:uncharacterized protein (UPF0332 family)
MEQLKYNERKIIKTIEKITMKNNLDNITRTDAYYKFFKIHPDIKWAFLASMVSRNGGYNMCDLQGEYFSQLLDISFRKRLFLTYERANWLIFHDVFPQLLIYDYSTKLHRPLFHLLKYFQVSQFIQKEWKLFWNERNEKRLITALIINEQNVIQKPIIEHPIYKKKVFHSFLFQFEDWLHFSCVLFPTCGGEVYGASVNGFRKLDKRIDLGKRLANILFDPGLYPHFFEFAEKTTHTGSRYDYERFFSRKSDKKTPFLRTTFPVVKHHIHVKEDWSKHGRIPKTWLHGRINHRHPIILTDWYEKKQNEIKVMASLNSLIK